MSNATAYPRSSARPIYLTAGVLGLLGLAGVIMMLIAMADVPRQSYYLLIAALGLLVVAFAGALAMLLTTNTRRPWGVDPNYGPYSPIQAAEGSALYRPVAEQAVRHAVQLPDGLGYGRRQSDDATVVRRLAATTERDDQPLPPTLEPPAWVSEILPPPFRDELAQPATEQPEPPLTKIPLDQLDLPPLVSNHTGPKEQRAGTEV